VSSGRDWFRHSRPPFTRLSLVGLNQRQRCSKRWDASVNYLVGRANSWIRRMLPDCNRLVAEPPSSLPALS
jgi:hypothetical protein